MPMPLFARAAMTHTRHRRSVPEVVRGVAVVVYDVIAGRECPQIRVIQLNTAVDNGHYNARGAGREIPGLREERIGELPGGGVEIWIVDRYGIGVDDSILLGVSDFWLVPK